MDSLKSFHVETGPIIAIWIHGIEPKLDPILLRPTSYLSSFSEAKIFVSIAKLSVAQIRS